MIFVLKTAREIIEHLSSTSKTDSSIIKPLISLETIAKACKIARC